MLAAIERDANTIREYDIERATRLIILKLVGYTETVHALSDRLEPSADTGIVLFGGRAKDMPYPGSTTVSTINGGVEGLTNTLALELAPIRVNALHPGIIGDSPFWTNKPEGVLDGYKARTPGGSSRRWQTSSMECSSSCATAALPARVSTSTGAGASPELRTFEERGMPLQLEPRAADVACEHPLRFIHVIAPECRHQQVVLVMHAAVALRAEEA